MPQRFAETPADLTPLSEITAMPGIAFIEGMLRGDHPGPPIAALLGFALTACGPGTATFRGRPAFAVTNPLGAVHGGWYGAILDSAMGCAVMTVVPARHWYTTLEYKVNIMRPVPLGAEVEAVGHVVHAGRSTAVAEAKLIGVADGRVHAAATTTCIIMPA
jgi:uncharacterized protein (TIGR00369 family)